MSKHDDHRGCVNLSRRKFFLATSLAGTSLAARSALGQENAEPQEKRNRDLNAGPLKIKVAGYKYDRVEGLADGRVPIERCETQFQLDRIGSMNTNLFAGPQTREVSEVGLLPFILAFANEEFRDYSLIPVFPLRLFRHKSIFIRTDRGISVPEDLRGKRVATPGYSSTSLTWIRGIMQHEYGVKPNEIHWVVSSKDSAAKESGGASALEKVLPEGLSISEGPKGKDESDLLIDGEVDALFHAAEPRAYQEAHPKVARLFSDSRKTERAYFAKTGIFPIMHAVAIRNDAVESHRWLPEVVFNAYSQAKQLAYNALKKTAFYNTSLPWIAQEAEATRKLMGDNYWPYGISPNRKTLDTLLQYSYEQGLAKRRLKIEDLFHRSTLQLTETPT